MSEQPRLLKRILAIVFALFTASWTFVLMFFLLAKAAKPNTSKARPDLSAMNILTVNACVAAVASVFISFTVFKTLYQRSPKL